MLRKKMKMRPLEELRKRNNVEATIFQFGYYLRNKKSKYRGLYKQKLWAYCRCLWINLVRIKGFVKLISQNRLKNINTSIQIAFFCGIIVLISAFKPNLNHIQTFS